MMGLIRHRKLYLIIIGVVLSTSLTAAFFVYKNHINALSGSDWQAGRIIDDRLFTNQVSMSVAQIQNFLEIRRPTCDVNGTGSVTYEWPANSGTTVTTSRAVYGERKGNPPPFTCLKDYYENPETKQSNYGGQPIPSGAKSAAQLIWEAANQKNISPQTLLITLQKEQGLLTDDWPFKSQFLKAMGAYCPDSGPGGSANCDPNYSGFSVQMLAGAGLFRYYLDNMEQPWWPYAKPGSRSVRYDVEDACGSANVFIENKATAALYTYTPYQPNAAALANLESTGDNCSAYGNRNFWRDYNKWFGPSTSIGYTLAIADNGDPRQWVIMNGKRYLVPDVNTKLAWGLPDTPITWDDLYLGSFPDGPNLTRLMRPNGSLDVYLIDNGKKYRVPNTQMFDVWNAPGSTGSIIDVSSGLGMLPVSSGELGFVARRLNDPEIYLIDSGVKRHITDPNVLAAWASDTPNITSLSDAFFTSLPAGGNITSPKITQNGLKYIIDSFRKLQLDSVTEQLYPSWTSHTVTPAIFNLFGTINGTYLIKSWSSPSVYLLDQNQKHHIIDTETLDAWSSATFPSNITTVSNGLVNLISSGNPLSDYLMSVSGNYYSIDKYQKQIPSQLQNAFITGRTVYSSSAALLSIYPASSNVTGVIKGANSPGVYLLTNSGSKRHLTSSDRLKLWNGGQSITTLRQNNINRYLDGGGIGIFVNDGSGNNYLIEGGQKHSIDNAIKSNWGLGASDTLSDGTLNRLNTGITIQNKLQNVGVYYLIHQGVAFPTIDQNIADMWGLLDAPVFDSALVSELLRTNMLTRIARSKLTGDDRLFIVNKGTLYRLYPNTAANLNASGPLTWVDPTSFTVADWTALVVKDEAGNNYVIDTGKKRPLQAGAIRDAWTFGNQSNVPTMGNGFLNTLPTTSQMERAVKGSGPNIYSVQNFQKKWIQSWSTYQNYYAPYTTVSDVLLDLLPNGSPIP